MTLHELSEKDVIQIKTGENLGRIDDVIFDEGAANSSLWCCMGEAIFSAFWAMMKT